jgi:hypothetical protein
MRVQAHNQAKSSATSALVKAQASKEQKEQEVSELHHALEESNRKLQVSASIAHQATVKVTIDTYLLCCQRADVHPRPASAVKGTRLKLICHTWHAVITCDTICSVLSLFCMTLAFWPAGKVQCRSSA